MNQQKGLAPIAILIIVTVLAVVGIAAYRNQNTNQNGGKTTTLTESPSPSVSPTPIPTAKPIVINKVASPTPTATPKTTSSPSPSATPSNLSCEIKIRGEKPSNSGYAPYTVYFFGTDNFPYLSSTLQWDFDGDGNWDTNKSSENYNTSYTYQKPGNYTVKLQTQNAKGDNSCTSTITAKPGTVECQVYANKASGNAPMELDFGYGTNVLGYLENTDINKDLVEAAQWDFDGNGSWDTSFDAASKTLKHTYSKAGNYTVKLQVRAQNNITSEVCTKNISVE